MLLIKFLEKPLKCVMVNYGLTVGWFITARVYQRPSMQHFSIRHFSKKKKGKLFSLLAMNLTNVPRLL